MSTDLVAAFATRIWLKIPRRIIAKFPGMRGVAGDGHYLLTVPPLAAVAPFATFISALMVGAGRLGYEDVYTQSTALLAAFIALGCLSSQLGLLAVAGFAIGEFVFAERSWTLRPTGRERLFDDGFTGNLARVRLPLLITYLVLAAVVIVIPRAARSVLLATGRWRRVPENLAWPVGSILTVVIVWIGVRTWTAGAATLVRPLFTWPTSGGAPPVSAVETLQRTGSDLVAAGVVATMVRQAWIGLTMYAPTVRAALRAAEQDPGGFPAVPIGPTGSTGATGAVGARPRSAARLAAENLLAAALASLTLTGILSTWWIFLLAFGAFFLVRVIRSGAVVIEPIEAWKRLTARVPFVVRLLVLWFAAQIARDAVNNNDIKSFTGLAVFVVVGTLAIFLIFPGEPVRKDTT